MRQIYLQSFFRSGYHRFMNYIYNISNHPKKEEIEKRLEIIEFFDKFGKEATAEAFSRKRSTVYLWKQKLRQGEGNCPPCPPATKPPRQG